MTIEILFGEICNFYGDPQNAEYLRRCMPDADIRRTAITDVPFFAAQRPDMILIGSMSESVQRRAISELMPYKERIEELIRDDVVFLATGNACEIFTKRIDYVTEGLSVDALGIFDLTVTTDLFKRYNGKVLGECDGITVTGFRSQFSVIHGNNEDGYFLKMKRGMGLNPESSLEGMRKNNFIGTQTLGPILPLNPDLTEYLIRLAGGNAPAAFGDVARAAKEKRLAEFNDPKIPF